MHDQYSDGVCVERSKTVPHQHQDGTLVGWMVDQQRADQNTLYTIRQIQLTKSEIYESIREIKF